MGECNHEKKIKTNKSNHSVAHGSLLGSGLQSGSCLAATQQLLVAAQVACGCSAVACSSLVAVAAQIGHGS